MAAAPTEDDKSSHIMLHSLKTLRDKHVGLDLTLYTRTLTYVQCHAVVAAANSTYIKECIEKEYSDVDKIHMKTPYNLKFDVWTKDTLGAVVEYFYTGKIDIAIANVKSILLTALLLDDEYLVQNCVKVIRKVITIDNCQDYYNIAQDNGMDVLKQFCWDFMSERLFKFEPEVVGKLSLDVVIGMLKKDTCGVENEDGILDCVVSWVKHNRDIIDSSDVSNVDLNERTTRDEFVKNTMSLLDCVRFEYCSSNAVYKLLTDSTKVFDHVDAYFNKKCMVQMCCTSANHSGQNVDLNVNQRVYNYKQVNA